MINKDEIIYKINIIIKYLKDNNEYNYKLYNHGMEDEPDSNIVEYAKDVKSMIEILFNNN
jgi:hypothetical protein